MVLQIRKLRLKEVRILAKGLRLQPYTFALSGMVVGCLRPQSSRSLCISTPSSPPPTPGGSGETPVYLAEVTASSSLHSPFSQSPPLSPFTEL